MGSPEIDNHLLDVEVERYSLGDVSDEELARWDEHLLVCASCRQRVAASDEYVAAVQAAAAEIRRAPPQGQVNAWSPFPRLVPAMAGLAVLAVLAVLILPREKAGLSPVALAVRLGATRGPGIEARAPAGRPLLLQPDWTGLPALPSYALELVDAVGRPVWKGAVPARDAANGARIPALRPGIYFLRVSSPQGQLYREYGLEAERAANK